MYVTVSGIYIDFGGSIEVETNIKFFGTRDPGSLRLVSETVADKCNKFEMVPRSLNWS